MPIAAPRRPDPIGYVAPVAPVVAAAKAAPIDYVQHVAPIIVADTVEEVDSSVVPKPKVEPPKPKNIETPQTSSPMPKAVVKAKGVTKPKAKGGTVPKAKGGASGGKRVKSDLDLALANGRKICVAYQQVI